VTEALLLDTHILLWLDSGSNRLRPSTRHLIDACWRAGGTILVSVVSVWEIALLVDTGRIGLDLPVEAWIERFAAPPGIDILSLDHFAAARAYRLHDLTHRDSGDRLLIATAIERSCPLVTYDTRIAAFAGTFGGQYGFTTRA
jgi:PIN domain nuclease of toxin-antitoxin system